MTKSILFARVSTKRQEEEGLSLREIQLPRLREYATEKGFDVVKEYVISESADQKIRKHFNEMVAFVKAHDDIKVIICFRVDRITRNYADAVAIDELRVKYDKELHFVHDRLVLSKKTVGRDIQDWDTKVFLAKQVINRLKEDAVNTARYKLSRGELPGPAKFGYKNVTLPDKRKWVVPDEIKSLVVKNIFEWYASGAYSLSEIRQKLHKDYQINKAKSSISDLLQDTFYVGTINYDGQQYLHHYDLFISQELFDKAQAVRLGRGSYKYKYAGLPFPYRGLLRCADCGCQITPERKFKKLKDGTVSTHNYYHCTGFKGKHEMAWVKEEDITSQFAAVFDGMGIPDDALQDILKTLRQSHKDKIHNFHTTLTHHQSEYARYEKRIERMYDDYLDRSITRDLYEQKKKEYRTKQAYHQEQMNRLSYADEGYYLTASYLVELAAKASELFARSEMHEKRQLLKLVLQNLKLDGNKVRYNLVYPFDKIFLHASRTTWLPG